ncbi:unnamed protein product [Durusdinium trenchii]
MPRFKPLRHGFGGGGRAVEQKALAKKDQSKGSGKGKKHQKGEKPGKSKKEKEKKEKKEKKERKERKREKKEKKAKKEKAKREKAKAKRQKQRHKELDNARELAVFPLPKATPSSAYRASWPPHAAVSPSQSLALRPAPSAAPEYAERKKELRWINLKKYCRQYLHKNDCSFGPRCKLIHQSYCRKYLMRGGCTNRLCDFKHLDICEYFQRRHWTEDCPRLPRCPFLHVVLPREERLSFPSSAPIGGSPSSSHSFPPVPPSLFLPPPPTPTTPVTSDDESKPVEVIEVEDDEPAEAKEEDFHGVPKRESQLTVGFARRYGYEDWGD